MAAQGKPKYRSDRQTLACCLRDFLTPAVWRSVHAEVPHWNEEAESWELTTLILTGLWMALQDGRQAFTKRFKIARETVRKLREKRKAPGETLNGYLQAISRLPYRALARLRQELRERVATKHVGLVGGWDCYAVDGSRVELPRTEAQERTWGCNREAEAPNLWVTAILHLGTGILCDWRIGPGNSCEREHLQRMLNALPRWGLIVADIGFGGFEQLSRIQAQGRYFLIRVCSTTQLLMEGQVEIEADGSKVWLWPGAQRGQAPLRLRLIRIKPAGNKQEVWLLTNVLDSQQLSRAQAQEIYAARWGIEVDVFRSLKQTMGKAKLMGRTPVVVLREFELALLALMLCQALGAQAEGQGTEEAQAAYSLARVQELLEHYGAKLRQGRKGWDFSKRLREAVRDNYSRKKPKGARRPVKIKEVHAPRPPKILVMDESLKRKLDKKLAEGKRDAA